MTLSFFDQFASPTLMGIPLLMLALLMPWLITPTPAQRWLNSPLLTGQAWFISLFSYQLFTPLPQRGQKWALLFATLLLFLICLNSLGLLPYTFTPTTQLSMTLSLAVPFWLTTVIIGMRHQPAITLAHLLPEGTPTPLIPVLIIIETMSLLIRPVALGVRLTANLTAGHLLIQLIATASVVLISFLPAVAAMTTIILFLLTLLEVAVAMIQAYVFVLLLSLYLQENI
uniref:ATP synthase subunit a n=1 Tax=Heteropriacanthus cruentatus TaxID=342441 RepID=Q0ZXR8_9TELE|nr:ATPase subunit 6 [Heteropriacanthus cruentatus]